MNVDANRDRGILSRADRTYLLGEAEMSHEQSKRNAEARIRRRVVDGILDFDLLVHYLERTDRKQVFERATTDEAFVDGLTAMLAFAYIGLREQGVDFEQVLVPAVESAEEVYAVDQSSTKVSVDVTFEVETTVESTLEGIQSRLADGEPVTPRELFSLVVEHGRDVAVHDRIRLRLADETGRDHVERLAAYLEADVRYANDSLAVLHWEGDDETRNT
ncbi:hypothetical protein ACFOZ7_19055 [Natribaculum luteum]|uniref:Domain of unknown function domain-containing protein n=1 Tax=Natribaculum luteum TaxID=1586232 RepID=A0ABD5P4B0_9EURY|nr:hypothetical protein [Natribaculum luteum]